MRADPLRSRTGRFVLLSPWRAAGLSDRLPVQRNGSRLPCAAQSNTIKPQVRSTETRRLFRREWRVPLCLYFRLQSAGGRLVTAATEPGRSDRYKPRRLARPARTPRCTKPVPSGHAADICGSARCRPAPAKASKRLTKEAYRPPYSAAPVRAGLSVIRSSRLPIPVSEAVNHLRMPSMSRRSSSSGNARKHIPGVQGQRQIAVTENKTAQLGAAGRCLQLLYQVTKLRRDLIVRLPAIRRVSGKVLPEGGRVGDVVLLPLLEHIVQGDVQRRIADVLAARITMPRNSVSAGSSSCRCRGRTFPPRCAAAPRWPRRTAAPCARPRGSPSRYTL